jgi:hypothetical protein
MSRSGRRDSGSKQIEERVNGYVALAKHRAQNWALERVDGTANRKLGRCSMLDLCDSLSLGQAG